MKHCMKLCAQPFDMISSGEKSVEIRLYDEKRRKLKKGDEIEFSLIEDGKTANKTLNVKITGLYRFNSFADLFYSDLYASLGSDEKTVEEFTNSMRLYYSKEQEQTCGVLAIKIKILN